MKSFRMLAFGAALAIGAATSIAAVAQDKVIADRQDFMKKQTREWIVVRNYLQGNADQQAATAAVDSLAKLVPDVPNHFPPGTAGPAPDGAHAGRLGCPGGPGVPGPSRAGARQFHPHPERAPGGHSQPS